MRKAIVTAAAILAVATLGTTMTAFGQTSSELHLFAYDDTPWEDIAGRTECGSNRMVTGIG